MAEGGEEDASQLLPLAFPPPPAALGETASVKAWEAETPGLSDLRREEAGSLPQKALAPEPSY